MRRKANEMLTYDEVKGKYLPHEIIDLYNAGKLSEEDMNLLLYGSKTTPKLFLNLDGDTSSPTKDAE